jgi:hypothetical protein
MRQQLSRASASGYNNADVKRMTLRDALQGYGTGLSQILGQAGQTAGAEYGRKYGYAMQGAQAQYLAQADAIKERNKQLQDVADTRHDAAMTQYKAQLSRDALAEEYENWKKQQDYITTQIVPRAVESAKAVQQATAGAPTVTTPYDLGIMRHTWSDLVKLGRA